MWGLGFKVEGIGFRVGVLDTIAPTGKPLKEDLGELGKTPNEGLWQVNAPFEPAPNPAQEA